MCGIKIRLGASLADEGVNEAIAFDRARELARAVAMPLMTHHTGSTIPIAGAEGCPGGLVAGDIYTHCFNGTIMDDEGNVAKAFHEARARGVLFDVGHGQGSFNYTIAERAAAEGFHPDIISSDLHIGGVNGVVYDLPTCLTKFMAIGMPLVDAIRAATATPAAALNLRDDTGRLLGSLSVGAEADISCFILEEVDVQLEDPLGQLRHVSERLRPAAVWKAGVSATVTEPFRWPNPEAAAMCRPSWNTYTGVKDAVPPPPVNPLYANAVAGRSEGLRFLAEKLDGPSGDHNPNMTLELTLGLFATAPQWLALPFCEAVETNTTELLMIEDIVMVDATATPSVRASVSRQLIGGFGLSDDERERQRQRLLCGCC